MTMHETEITVPVPWGHIAGKTWNKPTGTPVLLVHGLQNNAASFNRLVPLLPDSFFFVAIDLPGHGRSSHFPWGLALRTMDCVPAVERVIQFLGWKDFIYIGHSLGGIVGFFYCAIYPHRVRKFVALDVFIPMFTDEEKMEDFVNLYKHGLKEIEKRVESGKAPEYTYDKAVERLTKGPDDLSLESAKMLASRCLVKSGQGYRFSMDQRLKAYERTDLNSEQTLALFRRIKCPVMYLVSRQYYDAFWSKTNSNLVAISDTLKQNLKNSYRYHIFEGGHNVHMDFPERIRDLLLVFLSDASSRL